MLYCQFLALFLDLLVYALKPADFISKDRIWPDAIHWAYQELRFSRHITRLWKNSPADLVKLSIVMHRSQASFHLILAKNLIPTSWMLVIPNPMNTRKYNCQTSHKPTWLPGTKAAQLISHPAKSPSPAMGHQDFGSSVHLCVLPSGNLTI